MEITSGAFRAGERIPARHTGDGEDFSPALSWAGLPAGTKALALVCDDPDAPRAEPWVHWVIYEIPASAPGLPAAVSKKGRPREVPGALQGRSDFGEVGYGGPAPPRGHETHHYHFRVYALDESLGLGEGATKARVEKAMAGHVLATAEIVGTYSR